LVQRRRITPIFAFCGSALDGDALIITGVGAYPNLFTGYMHDDDRTAFFGWRIFTFAMLGPGAGENLWLLFVGWEA